MATLAVYVIVASMLEQGSASSYIQMSQRNKCNEIYTATLASQAVSVRMQLPRGGAITRNQSQNGYLFFKIFSPRWKLSHMC